jgi:hypothetical protein
MWVNGHTDIMKVIVAFCSFINMPKDEWKPSVIILFHHNFLSDSQRCGKEKKYPVTGKNRCSF